MENRSRPLWPLVLTVLVFSLVSGGIPPETRAGQAVTNSHLLLGRDTADRLVAETDSALVWSLPDGHKVRLAKRPKRVVVLLTSLLELWYETGGTAVARCVGSQNVPPPALDLPQVGTFNNPNVEKIIALQPDLVISSNLPAFRRMIPLLEENHIGYLYVNYINVYDYSRILTLFSKLNQTQDKVDRNLMAMEEKIALIQASVQASGQASVQDRPRPRVLVVFTTSNSVSCELDTSQTGVMLSLLGAENIIPSGLAHGQQTRVQFSLERIVSLDPDVILLNTMGDVEECQERLKAEFESNPAWAGLRAVQENRFFVLPKEYFLFKPNAAFPQALEYLAHLLYGQGK